MRWPKIGAMSVDGRGEEVALEVSTRTRRRWHGRLFAVPVGIDVDGLSRARRRRLVALDALYTVGLNCAVIGNTLAGKTCAWFM